jgi:hypothetical protein
VTVTAFEATVLGTVEPSVTWSSNSQTPTAERVPVGMVGREEVVHENELPRGMKLLPGASTSHWQVYGEVPPLNEVVVLSVEFSPLVIELLSTLMKGGVNAEFTATVTGVQEGAAVEVPTLLSVTFTE